MFTEPRVGCGAAIIVDDRILLVQRRRPPEIGHWGLPGGKIDLFETAAAATEREVMEETGISITAGALLCFVDHIDRAAGIHWTAPVFLVHAFEGTPENREPEKHGGVKWFALDALPEQLTISTRIAVEAWRRRGYQPFAGAMADAKDAGMITPPPAEWARHDAVWIGFPSHPELWLEDLEPAREEVVAFARAVHAEGAGERVLLVAANEEAAAAARAVAGDVAEVVVEPFGDIWLRDTAAILDGDGRAHDFAFNGWGGKYDLPGDNSVGAGLARQRGLAADTHPWIIEGGAIDGDGTGLVVTTEQCLLNPNRNGADFTHEKAEALLRADLGYTRVLWLGDGLLNDHTDGHVDNLARFVGPNRLAIPEPAEDDPNAEVYRDAAERAAAAGIEVVRIPSPGRVESEDEVIPASYMNFYIGNAAVVVPVYGQPSDDAAVAALAAIFPDRKVVGLRADHILTGGGSFHCISQQIPSR